MSVGALGSATADVDGRGVVAPRGLSFELACWVGADDGWRCGDEGDAARQSRGGIAPVLATTLRVPDGEAVERVWGVPDGGGLIVVEVENRSAAAIAVAFVLRPVSGGLLRALEVRDSVIVVDGQPAVLLPRAPRTWVVAPQGRGGTRAQIVAGDTSEGVFPGHSDRRGVEGAFVFPVPHRTSVRAVILLDPRRAAAQTGAPALPDAEVAARGWRAHLERGLRTDLPDDALQHAVDASRATLLLEASSRRRCTPDVVAALEDWGFDPEAEAAWRRLRMSDRRAASRRPGRSPDPWRRIDALLSEASPTITFPGGPAPFLRAVREALVDETGESVDLLPGFPPEWLGRDLAVHGVPVAGGDVSFALRWHGERPALLWEGPDALGLTASALDPGFAAPGGRGETLLARLPEPPRARAGSEGVGPVPESFA